MQLSLLMERLQDVAQSLYQAETIKIQRSLQVWLEQVRVVSTLRSMMDPCSLYRWQPIQVRKQASLTTQDKYH